MKNHRSARSKFNQAQVTASERAVSTEVPAIDVADTSRGSKRGAEEFRSVEDGEGQKGSTPPVRGSEINNMDEEAADVLDGDIAAIQGDVEIVKRNEGLIFSKKALDGAAGAGHLEMVKWLLKFKPEIGCSVDAMDLASQGRHLDVLEWLNKNSAEGCSRSALVIAAARGDMKTVQWLYSNAMHNGDITEAMDKALETGHAEVAEWLKIHLPNKNKKPRTASPTSPSPSPPAGTTSAESGGASSFQRPAAGGAHSSTLPGMPGNKPCNPMGMFGSPFGNFSPVNGIVLPGPTAQAIVPKQAATGAIPTPPGSGGSGPPRLRSNMLRSPELTLAMSGRLSNTDERQLKAVMEFRKAYSAQALEGSNIPKVVEQKLILEDPFTLFAVWFEEARIARASEPGAMCLSTVGPTGRPSARYVMLQGFDKRGFVWYTNFESRKAQELSQNPYGALSFWWSEVQRAVRIEGVVCKVTEKESTEYFQSRPRGSQVGAWALHQSRPVESRGSLETNVKDVQNKFSSMRDVPRPTHFGGFRLRPDRIEFWKGRQTRIHDRIVYVIMDDKWIMQRLQP